LDFKSIGLDTHTAGTSAEKDFSLMESMSWKATLSALFLIQPTRLSKWLGNVWR